MEPTTPTQAASQTGPGAEAAPTAGVCPFPHGQAAAPAVDAAPATCPFSSPRSDADRRMRRLLRIPEQTPRGSAADAQNAFSTSVFISAARCLLTYVVLPLMGPVLGFTDIPPLLGLIVGVVSIVAITASIRRFFRADHRWRWRYTAIGGGIIVLLIAQAVIDLADL